MACAGATPWLGFAVKNDGRRLADVGRSARGRVRIVTHWRRRDQDRPNAGGERAVDIALPIADHPGLPEVEVKLRRRDEELIRPGLTVERRPAEMRHHAIGMSVGIKGLIERYSLCPNECEETFMREP